jgi:coenzyme F420-0:L-glutamate ligase/coenzyme F420-1:gamma-L-glutamate ligase
MSIRIDAVDGVGEIRDGDDLGGLLAEAMPDLAAYDVLVVSSKAVAKAEGRVVQMQRDAAVAAETESVVARRGSTRIVRTRHGLVLAAAGVDESNTAPGTVVLLPIDPDASAQRIRDSIQRALGVEVAVIVSDTAGRPWRRGQTDIAVGCAGLAPLLDLRGRTDQHGRELTVTLTAVADELAAAADLAKGKASGRPAARIRGWDGGSTANAAGTALELIRDGAEDLFAFGPHELLLARRTVRAFEDRAVPAEVLDRALAAAGLAPAPHHTRPWRFVVVSPDTAGRLLDELAEQWRTDLRNDGLDEDAVARRVARGDVLRDVPGLLVPCLDTSAAHDYPDSRRAAAEERMFWLSGGAAIQNLLLSLTADGVGSAWVSSTLFAPEVTRRVLALDSHLEPLGAIAFGYPESRPHTRDDPVADLRLDR